MKSRFWGDCSGSGSSAGSVAASGVGGGSGAGSEAAGVIQGAFGLDWLPWSCILDPFVPIREPMVVAVARWPRRRCLGANHYRAIGDRAATMIACCVGESLVEGSGTL